MLGERGNGETVPFAFGTDFVAIDGEVFANACVELVQSDGESLHHIFSAGGTLGEAAHAVTED